MKKLLKISFLVLLFSATSLFAQDLVARKPEKNVPIIVAETFELKFPNNDPVWFSQYQGRYDDNLVYEARFLFDNRYSAAVYNKEGIMLAFVATIEESEIPQKALDYMKKNYPYQHVVEAVTVSHNDEKATVELGIYLDDAMRVMVFDKEGNFIKSTRG